MRFIVIDFLIFIIIIQKPQKEVRNSFKNTKKLFLNCHFMLSKKNEK
jgi:hypothetical protein